MDDRRKARHQRAHDDVLADAIDALRESTERRHAARSGSPEHEAALKEEERLHAFVIELVRRRNRMELGSE